MIVYDKSFKIEPNDFVNAGYVSSTIKKQLTKMGVTKDKIKRIAIATYEAEINVVIHSYGGICECHIHNNRITVRFKDYGPGIEDIQRAMIAGYSTAGKDAKENGFGAGMGLANIKQASDEFRLASSPVGTILEVTIYYEVISGEIIN